jgi:release factor glutamine methyltransferase
MTSLYTIQKIYLDNLDILYEKSEIESIFFQIVHHLLNYSKIQIHEYLHKSIKPTCVIEFNKILDRLQKSEPIQYILGVTEFYNTVIHVDSRVLIPRPETELLVDLIVKANNQHADLKIIDLCTGSGCIAIALAKALHTETVIALDKSSDALELAKQNAIENKVKLHFIEDDLLHLHHTYSSFNIIVSNPPYVTESEKKLMHSNILLFEPHSALFVSNDNPLMFYRAIGAFGLTHLQKGGVLYAEINENYGMEVTSLYQSMGFLKVFIEKDLQQKDRFILAYL